jgi:Fur family ferric uptake transcriptional regulator
MPEARIILERLEREGHRLTGPRRAVLEQVVGQHASFTSAELLEAMQERCPGIGRATVFRTLDLLTRMGVVQRIHADAGGGRCHAYLACSQEHHHHVICEECGAVADFTEGEALEALVREIERNTSFDVHAHRLEFVGRCPACSTPDGERPSP